MLKNIKDSANDSGNGERVSNAERHSNKTKRVSVQIGLNG